MTENSKEIQKTPIFDEHLKLKAKMAPFGGWMMPISYEGTLAEHKWVRTQCGIFDVSHMGEIRVSGDSAEKFLQFVTMNDVRKISPGQGQYSALLNPDGGFVDDLILYKISETEFFLCVNASNSDKDYAWLNKNLKDFSGVAVTNESNLYAQIAVQGPTCGDVVAKLFSDLSVVESIRQLPYMSFLLAKSKTGVEIFLARTGYTGEKGFELYVPSKHGADLWRLLLEIPQVKPIGLGARDTLRLESCYLLYGNDMNDGVTPIEAGVSWALSLDKGEFIGREPLSKQKKDGAKYQTCAFTMVDQGIARHGMRVLDKTGVEIGVVCSGSVLPTIGGAGGMLRVTKPLAFIDNQVFIDIRGKSTIAKIVRRPLYNGSVKN